MLFGRFFHFKLSLFTLCRGNLVDTYPVFEPMLGAYVVSGRFSRLKKTTLSIAGGAARIVAGWRSQSRLNALAGERP